jgi:CHAD domain-containing protein
VIGVRPNTRPDIAARAVLQFLASALATNVACVMTQPNDEEGPHQLRVTLRRLRIALRTFGPTVLGPDTAKKSRHLARDLGAIVGELRDADVMIDHMIRPHAGRYDVCLLVDALDRWRENVRFRVRRGLAAARAVEFAQGLELMLERDGGMGRPKFEPVAARALADAAVYTAMKGAAVRGRRIQRLTADDLHELRKDIKGLRYAAEIAVAISADHAVAAMVGPLKGLQGALGRLNDLATLAQFDPPLRQVRERKMLRRVRKRILAQHAKDAKDALCDAAARWAWLERSGMMHWKPHCHKVESARE